MIDALPLHDLLLSAAAGVNAGAVGSALPGLAGGFESLTSPEGISSAMKIALLLTALSLLPSMLVMFTCFIRIVVVMHLLRQAMGTQTVPPNQVVTGLSLILTIFIMSPVTSQIYDNAIVPYQQGQLEGQAALEEGLEPVKEWMLRNTRQNDLMLFTKLAGVERPETRADIPLRVLMPAYLISELKTAFQIGFLLFMPFLVIDLVVSSVLLSMGMMMLPPVMVSFPFKILLFVMVDGWHLLVASLVGSFN